MENRSDEAIKLLAEARAAGAGGLCERLLSSRAAMPSCEDINAELFGKGAEQRGDVVIVYDPDNSTAECALNKHELEC